MLGQEFAQTLRKCSKAIHADYGSSAAWHIFLLLLSCLEEREKEKRGGSRLSSAANSPSPLILCTSMPVLYNSVLFVHICSEEIRITSKYHKRPSPDLFACVHSKQNTVASRLKGRKQIIKYSGVFTKPRPS